MNDIFIALDLETTGFNPDEDQVIEIAAIKFQGDKVIDTFESLVNPNRQIPPIITHITGITDKDLENAPTFKDIQEKLSQFIGNYPIVGHNIPFDVGFLNQKGMSLKNDLYDTLHLASILLPGLPSYSLDTLTRILKIEHTNKHRALSDTKATQTLFSILHKKIEEIDSETLSEIEKVLDKSTWSLRKLFLDQLHSDKTSKKTSKDNTLEEEQKSSIEITEDQFNNFFNEDGPFSQIIKDYESRPSQNSIKDKILRSFQLENHILLEAGTGTGKTIAYLLAAVYFSKLEKKKIVISTYTKNLQDQIINKDIPQLKKALEKINTNIDFSSMLLKGRSNYLSMKRLHAFMEKDTFMDHETVFLLKIIFWLKVTKTGDLDELNIQGKEFPLRFEVCYEDFSNDEADPHYAKISFLKKARLKAEQADIIVVNHALLLQNTIAESAILPDHDYIIFDEAHHLEKVTTDSLTINLSINAFAKPFEKYIKLQQQTQFGPQLESLSTKINQIIIKAELFFGVLGIFMEKFADPTELQYQFLIKEESLNSLEWNKVQESATTVSTLTDELLKELYELSINLAEEDDEIGQEIKTIIFDIEKRRNDIKTIFLSGEWNKRVQWTYKTYEGSSCLKSAPINVGESLHKYLFNAKKSIILTSATLQTENSFNFIKKQLNLDSSIEEIALPSHFSYPDQVKILIPEDLPRPATEGYFKSCTKIIKDIVIKNEGRTLVLFTSKKALSATYMTIAPELKKEGINVLAQGISGGKGKILEQFKEEPQACTLFGTASFWEGVDIPGDLLTCLIMQKLPFDPPSDPIIYSRSLLFDDSFNEYQLPLAILKFKQGFGRLIRTSKDKGSMIVLDSRIIQNSYGHKFLESLPEGINIEYGPVETIAEKL